MSAHTPRPWEFDGENIIAANGCKLARIDRDMKSRGKERLESREYENGNGTLMAAAPDLLAALREANEILERHFTMMTEPHGISDEQRAAVKETAAYKTAIARLQRQRDAIAKATNQESA